MHYMNRNKSSYKMGLICSGMYVWSESGIMIGQLGSERVDPIRALRHLATVLEETEPDEEQEKDI